MNLSLHVCNIKLADNKTIAQKQYNFFIAFCIKDMSEELNEREFD
jgi:hypothetical protein